MKYFLHAEILDVNPRVGISAADFEAIRASRDLLNAAFALEEVYDLVLSNYREFELAILSTTLNEMSGAKDAYADHFEVRSGFNRRTLNLLNSARHYLDQHKTLGARLKIDLVPIETLRRSLYDESFEYRFMEALRNHVQHAGRAVHSVVTERKWHPANNDRRSLEFVVMPYALKPALAEDPKFKRVVLAECPDRINISSAARKHIEGISKLHEAIRLASSAPINEARLVIEAAVEKHKKRARKRFVGLLANAQAPGREPQQIPVFLEWDNVRLKLVKVNQPLTNLSVRYVSNAHDANPIASSGAPPPGPPRFHHP